MRENRGVKEAGIDEGVEVAAAPAACAREGSGAPPRP